MRLRFIELENYRRYRHAALELPDGLVSIVGPNGAGKSTLMEAMAWAMFGNQTEIVRTGKDSIRRQGAGPAGKCRVRLEFDYEETGYVLERSMKGKNLTMDATLYAGSSMLARGAEEVSAALRKLFGMDHKSFFISVFARQKELNALSMLRKGERRDMVLRLLGITDVDDAIRRIREDLRHAKNALEAAKERLTGPNGPDMTQVLDAEISDIEKRIRELAGERKKAARELEKAERVHAKLKKELASLQRDAERREELEGRLRALTARLEERQSQRKKLARELEALEELEAKLEERRERALRAEKDLEKLLARLKNARADREKLGAGMGELRADIRQVDREIARVRKERSAIEKMGPDSDCPTCKRRLGDTYGSLLNEMGARLEELEARKSSLQEELAGMEGGAEELDAMIVALEKRETMLRDRINDFRMLASQAERAEKVRERLDELDKGMDALKADISAAGRKLDELDFDPEAYARAREMLDSVVGDLREKERQVYDLEAEEKVQEERLAGRRRERKRLDEAKAVYEESMEMAGMLKALEGIMLDFKKHLISRIRPALSDIGSQLLSELTDGRYTEMVLDQEYEISIRDQGELHGLERFSGGEKDLANLCLRLAISEVIATRHGTRGFDMIVLDEVFGSLDAERKRVLLATLNGLGNRFKQIFLITHVEDVKELMDNVIRVSMQPDGTSAAEVVR